MRFVEKLEYANAWKITQYLLLMALLAHWVACVLIAISKDDEAEVTFRIMGTDSM